MDKIKVSVLTPAYNVEKYIGEAIESILEQTFTDFEYIILDDCSTDATWNIIEEYAQKYPKIKAFRNEKNLGISGARNKLVAEASGKYIVWQDADDISLPYRIEHQYDFMEQHPEVGICGGFLQFFNESGNTSIRKYAPDDQSLRKKIFRYSPVAQPGAIVRKEAFKNLEGYSEKWPGAEDLNMSFKIGEKYKFANLQEIVIKYREQIGSITFRKLKTLESHTLEIRMRYIFNVKYNFGIFDAFYNALQLLTLRLFPTKLRIKLFNLIRNSK